MARNSSALLRSTQPQFWKEWRIHVIINSLTSYLLFGISITCFPFAFHRHNTSISHRLWDTTCVSAARPSKDDDIIRRCRMAKIRVFNGQFCTKCAVRKLCVVKYIKSRKRFMRFAQTNRENVCKSIIASDFIFSSKFVKKRWVRALKSSPDLLAASGIAAPRPGISSSQISGCSPHFWGQFQLMFCSNNRPTVIVSQSSIMKVVLYH